jgi:hypothetical protein
LSFRRYILCCFAHGSGGWFCHKIDDAFPANEQIKKWTDVVFAVSAMETSIFRKLMQNPSKLENIVWRAVGSLGGAVAVAAAFFDFLAPFLGKINVLLLSITLAALCWPKIQKNTSDPSTTPRCQLNASSKIQAQYQGTS